MSFPRYASYRPSGVEWLGDLPAHWSSTPLKYLVQLRSGGTPSKENRRYWDGSIPWASAKDLKSERLTDTQDHVTELAIDEGAADLVPSGALLVLVRGMTLAHSFPVVVTECPMAINQDLKAVLPRANLEQEYLAWLLRGSSEESLRRVDEAGHGTKALRMEAWTSMMLPLPPSEEQRAIVAFLDRETAKIDALVDEQERLIELLREKRQAVISHAVTKGLYPNAPMKDSGIEWLGEVPEHWEMIALKRLARIRYGIGEPPVYRDAGVPLIRATDIHAGQIVIEGVVKVDPADIPERRIVWLCPGDIIVVRSGAYTGDIGLVQDEHCPSIAGFDMVVTPDRCAPKFLMYALLSSYMRSNQIDLLRLRAAQPHLNAEELGGCFVMVPSTQEQYSVVAFLDAETAKIDAMISEAEAGIALLRERRSALISAAVTGKIHVRGFAQDAAEAA